MTFSKRHMQSHNSVIYRLAECTEVTMGANITK